MSLTFFVTEQQQNLGRRIGTSEMHLSLSPSSLSGSIVVDSLLIVAPIVGFCVCSVFCCTLLCVLSSFAIILMGKREMVALLFCLPAPGVL